MRTLSAQLLAWSWGILAAVSLAGASAFSAAAPQDNRPRPVPAPPPQNAPPAPLDLRPRPVDVIQITQPKPPDPAELAGLPPGSHPEILTWERAYTLALIRSRTPRPAQGGKTSLAESLDPKALAEQSTKLGVADFARFRTDFFAGHEGRGTDDGTFLDPSGSMFDLLRRLQVVENAKKEIDALAQFKAIFTELVKAEASGLTQYSLDQTDGMLQQARRRYLDELRGYRDRLDEVKVELGLSPHAAVIPDQANLAPVISVFDAVDAWQRNPRRKMEELPRLAAKLPLLDDVVLDFIAERRVFETIGQDPNRLEPILAAAEHAAIKNWDPGGDAARLALRVRRRVRHMANLYMDYEIERRALVLARRMKDDVFEELVAPPAEEHPPRKPPGSRDLIAAAAKVWETENRFVALWASFQTERLALYRDLRSLPYNDWKAFYAQFATGPTDTMDAPGNAAPPPQGLPPRRP